MKNKRRMNQRLRRGAVEESLTKSTVDHGPFIKLECDLKHGSNLGRPMLQRRLNARKFLQAPTKSE